MGVVVKSPRRSTTRPVANDTHIFAGFRKLFFGEARNAATVRSVRVGPRGGGQNSATFESGTGGQEEKVGRRILRKTFFFDRVRKQQKSVSSSSRVANLGSGIRRPRRRRNCREIQGGGGR